MYRFSYKYLLLALCMLSTLSLMGQNPQVILPADGDWPTVVGDSIMLIGPNQESLTEEQRYFNPPYLLVYPGKEHLKNDMIRAALCDCDPTQPNRRIGVFSVSGDKKVSFSQGNLQYLPAANIWKFADTQYEYLGNANKYLSPTFRNWVDLFGWSANNTTAPFGVSTSTNAADYAGAFVDWGENEICGDAPNTWRTLSNDEWEYLINTRPHAANLQGIAQVNGVNGLILLPDDWVCPMGVSFVHGFHSNFGEAYFAQYQQFTLDQWIILEQSGAVFLPASKWRNGNTFTNSSEGGHYWSSTYGEISTNAHYFSFGSQEAWINCNSLHRCFAVRLVHDTIVSQPIPDPCLVVKVNDTLSINMMCVEGGTFTMGDGENAHQVSLSSYSIGQTEVTQALWEAVMGTNPSANTANKQLPVTNISWFDCQEFIKKLNQLTGMRFRLPTEAEWEYAARGGQKSKGYTYAGSNDLKEVAWYASNSGNKLHAVGEKLPNELGIYDMSGNAWEWCHDWHAPYPTTHQYNPLGPEVGKAVGKQYIRVFRGGSYGYAAAYHQNTFRDITGPEPDKGTANLGLRLVLSDEVNFQTIHVNDTLSFHMMDVKGGTFMMGAMEGDTQANANEKPAHEVTLTYDYHIMQTEVTQALWKAVMGNNPSTMIGDDLPVNNVLWEEADAFVKRLSQMTGYTFHLPTEAEWEFAARGGKKSKDYLYAGSNKVDEVAWYNSNSGGVTHPVAQKMPNELGIYDMSGNVWEWCSDWLAPYTAEAQLNPTGPATGECHVYHGGGWTYGQNFCRSSHRRQTVSGYVQQALGLRVVLREKVEPEYVDLGLSVKWATVNVGATSPEDYGDYFAWGETEPKEEYSWATYKWCQGTANTLTKYCSNGQYGNADYKTILDPEDDAAIVHWGSDWRMPTIDEWLELKQNCSWKKIIINGITGYQVTAKNGNSIFLPRAGLRMNDILYANDSVGYYASNSHLPEFSHEDYASYMLMYDNSISKSSTVRYYGLSIRPVYDDRVTLTVIPTPADATVGFYYSEGFNVDSNSVKVKKGSSPLYQVAATKKGYLSQGDTLHHITQDTTLYIELRPFSKGTWVKVDTSEFTRVDSFFVSRHQGVFSGPYSSWSYFYAPVLPGETYRVRAHAGQHAALWYAASNAPDQAAGIRPTKVACSANGGIVRYIAEEFTIPEGANYLIINAANKGTNLIIERKVPDPCLVVKVNDTLSINLMCVEGGTFRMGVGADNYIERDDPQANKDSTTHLVTLSDYYMAETAVTQGLWQAVMGTDIHDMVAQSRYPDDTPKVGDRYPMGYVVLKDALAFVDELNKLTGLHFRLPTEAEREYAARGGKRSREYKYPGSNDYTQVASPYGTPVAQKLPNELGIYDLSGCTREMCTDSWRTTYIYDEHVVNPVGPIQNAGNRTMRGGHIHSQSHPFTRYPFTPTWCRNELGFRIILPTETQRRMIHVNGSFFEMCFVKGGTFMMGSDAPDAQADEQPVHEVTLSNYYIGQTEVTQHLWQAVMGDENNPSATKGNNLPVTNITWDEAQTFVDRLSEMTGMHFRLPTEAEWEYAARGGQKSKGYTYAGSDDIDEVGWYAGNSDNKTHTVGQKLPNELGMYDMTGNVWEWCTDTFDNNSEGHKEAVLRGGAYDNQASTCQIASSRALRKITHITHFAGLRIVLEPEKYYRYGYTQEAWDAATSSWGHQGRGHAPADQSCIQGTMVYGIRLKVARAGSLNVYKVLSLLEKNEDNFELVATLTTDSTGVQDFDFAEPIYIAPNEYLVFGKPSEEEPTLRPCYVNKNGVELPKNTKGFAHYIGTDKAKVGMPNGSLMVEFY